LTATAIEAETTAVASGVTRGPWMYVSSEVHESEQRGIFGRARQFGLHESEIAEPGTYVLARCGDRELIVARDTNGAIRAEMQAQEAELSENVQESINSGAFERGIFHLHDSGTAEHGARHFQLLVLQSLRDSVASP
jgi:hypothetical protein